MKLRKLLGIYNKEKYLLVTWVNSKYELYLKLHNVDEFLNDKNKPILASEYGDTTEDLIYYLKKHDGFEKGSIYD